MRGDNGWGSGATGFFVSRRALAHSRAELAPRHSAALAN